MKTKIVAATLLALLANSINHANEGMKGDCHQERQGPAQGVWLHRKQGHRYVQHMPASLPVLLYRLP